MICKTFYKNNHKISKAPVRPMDPNKPKYIKNTPSFDELHTKRYKYFKHFRCINNFKFELLL